MNFVVAIRMCFRLKVNNCSILVKLSTTEISRYDRCLIDHMYQYSLDSFVTFFVKSISKAKPAETVDGRVLNLRDALRMTIFTWVSRGLFERHKLIFLSQLAFNLMKRGILGEDNMINELHFQFLLRGPRKQVKLGSRQEASRFRRTV